MTTFLLMNPAIRKLWESFAESKEYRDNFVSGFVKKSIPSQIRSWMSKLGITQQQLAERSGITQGVISRAANPNYGDLTLNTILKISSGLDCVFVCKYVPYSEFCKMAIEGSFAEDADTMLSFEQENKKLTETQRIMHVEAKIAEEDALVMQLGMEGGNDAAGQCGYENNVMEFSRKPAASVSLGGVDQSSIQQEVLVNG